MNKKIIVRESQLREYIKRKKNNKVFCEIIESLYKNSKFLSEHISKEKTNKSIIENYKRKGLITPEIENLLKEYQIIKEN